MWIHKDCHSASVGWGGHAIWHLTAASTSFTGTKARGGIWAFILNQFWNPSPTCSSHGRKRRKEGSANLQKGTTFGDFFKFPVYFCLVSVDLHAEGIRSQTWEGGSVHQANLQLYISFVGGSCQGNLFFCERVSSLCFFSQIQVAFAVGFVLLITEELGATVCSGARCQDCGSLLRECCFGFCPCAVVAAAVVLLCSCGLFVAEGVLLRAVASWQPQTSVPKQIQSCRVLNSNFETAERAIDPSSKHWNQTFAKQVKQYIRFHPDCGMPLSVLFQRWVRCARRRGAMGRAVVQHQTPKIVQSRREKAAGWHCCRKHWQNDSVHFIYLVSCVLQCSIKQRHYKAREDKKRLAAMTEEEVAKQIEESEKHAGLSLSVAAAAASLTVWI